MKFSMIGVAAFGFLQALTASPDGKLFASGQETLDALKQEVTDTVGVEQSAIVVLDGIAARIQSAVDQALANGATAEQLAPVTDEIASLKVAREGLATAVAANQG